MTRVKRCDCCDLPESMCGKAAEQAQRAEEAAELAAVRAQPGVIESRWTTRCPACNGRIHPGQLIRFTGEDLPWRHAWEGDCA